MGFFFISLKPRHGLAVGRGTGCFKPLGYFDEDCISIKSLPDNLPIVRELLATAVASTRKHKYEKHTKYTMRSLFTLPSASLPSGGATPIIFITFVADNYKFYESITRIFQQPDRCQAIFLQKHLRPCLCTSLWPRCCAQYSCAMQDNAS